MLGLGKIFGKRAAKSTGQRVLASAGGDSSICDADGNVKIINHAGGSGKQAKEDQCKECDETRRRRLRRDAKFIAKRSEHIRSLERDFQTYIPPVAYEAATNDPDKDARVNSFVADWMRNCDFFKRRTFTQMLGLAEALKVRYGYHGIAVVDDAQNDSPYLKLQELSAERIGNPDENIDKGHQDFFPPQLPVGKRNSAYYYEGIEFNDRGQPVRVHTWRKLFKTPDDAAIIPVGGASPQEIAKTALNGRSAYVYSGAFDWENFFLFSDPVESEEFTGASELEQAIEQICSVIAIMRGSANQAEFWARFNGFLKGGDGEIDGDLNSTGGVASCSHCDNKGCEHCCKPNVINVGFNELWALPEGKDLVPADFKIDPATFRTILDTLISSAPIACHLPPSFSNVQIGKAQGTQERIALDKAQAELRRRRQVQRCNIFDAIAAAVVFGKERRDPRLTDVSAAEIFQGELLFGKDLSADLKSLGRDLREDRKAGLRSNADIHHLFGRSPDRVRRTINREVQEYIADVREISGRADWTPTPEQISNMLREPTPGTGTPPTAGPEQQPEDDDSDEPPTNATDTDDE